jgi:hypothetical protein
MIITIVVIGSGALLWTLLAAAFAVRGPLVATLRRE